MLAQNIFAIFAIVLGATSCTDGGEDQRAPGSNYFIGADSQPNPANTPPVDSIDAAALAREKAVDKLAIIAYTQDLQPKIANYCISCHGLDSKLDLSSYEAVKAAAGKMSQAIRSKKMPPKSVDLGSDVQKKIARLAELLDSWDDKPSESAEDLTEFSDLTFNETIGPLLAEVCAKCHGGDAPKGDIILTNETELEARLDNAISAVRNGKMPPKLDDARREQVARMLETWRDKGKP